MVPVQEKFHNHLPNTQSLCFHQETKQQQTKENNTDKLFNAIYLENNCRIKQTELTHCLAKAQTQTIKIIVLIIEGWEVKRLKGLKKQPNKKKTKQPNKQKTKTISTHAVMLTFKSTTACIMH